MMYEVQADLVFTGEVLGQRPKSQRNRKVLELIELESGLKDRLLRPLSAKLLPPTLYERIGLLDRSKFLAIKGRSRKVQLLLASNYRFRDYSPPAGGCILTSKEFGAKFKEMRKVKGESLDQVDWFILRNGKMLKLDDILVIVPRDRSESSNLESTYLRWGFKVYLQERFLGIILTKDLPSHEMISKAVSLLISFRDNFKEVREQEALQNLEITLRSPRGNIIDFRLKAEPISREEAHSLVIN